MLSSYRFMCYMTYIIYRKVAGIPRRAWPSERYSRILLIGHLKQIYKIISNPTTKLRQAWKLSTALIRFQMQHEIPIIVTPPPPPPMPTNIETPRKEPVPPRPPLPVEVRMPGRPPAPAAVDTDDEEGLFSGEPGSNRPIHAAAHGLYQEVRQVGKHRKQDGA